MTLIQELHSVVDTLDQIERAISAQSEVANSPAQVMTKQALELMRAVTHQVSVEMEVDNFQG